jgi:hypothetical protein
MKYSLRSLMIVVTLICVIVGGRIEYLRRMAAWHEQEARRFDLKMIETVVHQVEGREKRETGSQMMTFHLELDGDEARASRYHETMAVQFRNGLLRPWSPVVVPPGLDMPGDVREYVAHGR